jgi:hypothetical protein
MTKIERPPGAAARAAEAAPEDPDHPGYALLPDDARYLEAFERALDDPEPCVRRAGMNALLLSLWTGSPDILRRHRESLPEFVEQIDAHLDAEFPRVEKPTPTYGSEKIGAAELSSASSQVPKAKRPLFLPSSRAA